VVRAGQASALLGALIVIAWYCIQKDRPVWAGVSIGVASSLKLFPAVLLIYFLLRHRRAFLAGVATILAVNATTAAFCGLQSFPDYLQTAHFVAQK
jgi:uncharacterized membrane protein